MSLKDKIIAFDIDGTLARNNTFPSKYTYDEVNRLIKEGYHITLVTGRSIVSAIGVYKDCGMNKVCVLCNGALVYDPILDVKLRNITIPFDVLNNVIHNDILMSKIKDVLVEIDYNSYSLTGKGWPNCDYVGDFDKTLPSEPNALVIMVNEYANQKEVADIINVNSDYHYRYWYLVGEFYNLNFSKKEGVVEMLKHYNKTKEDLIFFGDGENDRELLEYAGLGVAMKNADDVTKSLANEVTEFNNEEDGAIKHLLKMIENDK